MDKYRNDIVLDILKDNYIPSAIKGVEIPKGNGQVRLLGVPTVVDRWLQQAVSQQLDAGTRWSQAATCVVNQTVIRANQPKVKVTFDLCS